MNKKIFSLLILLILIIIFIKIKHIKIEKFLNKNNNYDIRNIVDEIYIINMDKDADRMKKLNNKMNKLGLKYKRISGIDGKKIYEKYEGKTNLRPGQLGCLLSHQIVLKDAIKNNYNNILVLEDDVIFHKDFHNEFKKKFKYLIDREKNFDLIYLGCSQKHNWKNINIKKEYLDGYKMDGTFSMIINNNIYKKIINLSNNLDKPIDRVLYDNIQKNNTYCFYPYVVSVNGNCISNTENYYNINQKYYKSNRIDINDFNIN